LTELQTQLHDTLASSLVSNVGKVHAFKGVITEPLGIKCEIGLLRELVQKITSTMISGDSENGWNRGEEREEEFGDASSEVGGDNSRSISCRAIEPVANAARCHTRHPIRAQIQVVSLETLIKSQAAPAAPAEPPELKPMQVPHPNAV
jgi:hypothetical protein